MFDFSHLNYWAVVGAFFINTVVGAFWYSPAGFAPLWSKLTGKDLMKMPKNLANQAIAITAVSAALQSVLLAVVVRSLHGTTFADGLAVGAVLWAGFIGATTISDTLYARRGWKLWCLNSSFYLLVILVNSVLFALWR